MKELVVVVAGLFVAWQVWVFLRVLSFSAPEGSLRRRLPDGFARALPFNLIAGLVLWSDVADPLVQHVGPLPGDLLGSRRLAVWLPFCALTSFGFVLLGPARRDGATEPPRGEPPRGVAP